MPTSKAEKRPAEKLSFSRELKVGDLLTALTILISLATVVVSWNSDRRLRITKDADEIRLAAATTIGELERWEAISLSITADIQPAFVEAGEQLARSGLTPVNQKSPVQVRDQLWKKFNELSTAIDRRILDERIESGYLKLFAYFPNTRTIYASTLKRLRTADTEMRKEFLAGIESNVLAFQKVNRDSLQSAEVGNALRRVAAEIGKKYSDRFRQERAAAETFLVAKVGAKDDELLEQSRNAKLVIGSSTSP